MSASTRTAISKYHTARATTTPVIKWDTRKHPNKAIAAFVVTQPKHPDKCSGGLVILHNQIGIELCSNEMGTVEIDLIKPEESSALHSTYLNSDLSNR